MQVIVDLDFLVYRAGFAAETRSYDVAVELPSGEIEQKLFSPVSSCAKYPDGASAGDVMKAYIATLPEGSHIISKETVISPEPESHALHIASEMIHNMLAAVKKELPKAKTKKPRMLLTGKRNYRYHIATIKPYKGNRDADTRPVHYDALRAYLIKHHKAEVIEGHEADDEASIAMWSGTKHIDKVLISQDKDLDQAPGMHFDPVKKVFYTITAQEADRAFWLQVLSGDATDNIPGCYKIGTTKAAKLIDSLDCHPLMPVVAAYEESIAKHGNQYGGLSAADAMLETGRLVRMQRTPYELWHPAISMTGSTKELEEKEYVPG
jgi:hypothetical protein